MQDGWQRSLTYATYCLATSDHSQLIELSKPHRFVLIRIARLTRAIQAHTPVGIDAFRRTKGKGKKRLGRGKKGTGKNGNTHYMDLPADFEDLAYYTKGRGNSKGRKGYTSRPWTPKGNGKRFSLTT